MTGTPDEVAGNNRPDNLNYRYQCSGRRGSRAEVGFLLIGHVPPDHVR